MYATVRMTGLPWLGPAYAGSAACQATARPTMGEGLARRATVGAAMLHVVVLADADDASLRLLDGAGDGVRFAVGQDALALVAQMPDAEVLFYCTGGRERLEAAFQRLPRLLWVHSRWAGLDGLLFPALAESPVTLTNSRGVFSRTLAEFSIGAILYFSKDFARMRRQQAARSWEPFLVEEVHGRTLGIIGYGDIGRAIAERAKALGMWILAMRRGSRSDLRG